VSDGPNDYRTSSVGQKFAIQIIQILTAYVLETS
jgi:hypothetical protein